MWDVTAEVIRRWDPNGLIAGGTPGDEFDREITSLVAQINSIKSAADATHAVSRIFSASFDPCSFSPDSCSGVGEKLFAALSKRGLLK